MESSSSPPAPCLCLRRVGRRSSLSGIGDVFLLYYGLTTLGRSRTSPEAARGSGRHIHLDSSIRKEFISRQHARLTCSKVDDGASVQVQIADLSINGVFVNDKKIGRPTDISAGDVVTFGHIRGAALSAGTHASQPESEFQFRLEEFRSTAHAATGSDTTAARVADPCSRGGSQQQPTVMTPSVSAAPAPLSQGSVELYSAEDSQHSVCSAESFCFSTGLLRPCSPQSPDDDSSRDESPRHASPSLLHMADSESPVPDSCVLDTSLNLPMLSMVQPLSNPCTNGPLISDDDAPYTNTAPGSSPEVDDGDRQSVLSSPLTLPSTRTEPVCDAGDSSCRLGSDIQLESKSGNNPATIAVEPERKRRSASAGVALATATLLGRQKPVHESSDSEEYHDSQDMCASVDCLQPGKENVLDWVQCDACQLWYHAPCVLASSSSAIDRLKRSEFKCGCV